MRLTFIYLCYRGPSSVIDVLCLCYRGSATEWYEALTCNLRSSKNVRMWFAQHVMFSQPGRFAEYLLECPSSEVHLY